MSSHPHPKTFKNTQPPTYSVTLRALVSFPFRLCNPPPAVGKVRSCGVTPLYKLRLDDVLDRKHLPPLGLKDFEEWLLFVEMSPENLYFTLWLREYKQRYEQWKSQTAFQAKDLGPDYPLNWSAQYSSQLAMFYARAKQTFFTPGSEYELNLSSTILAPFHQTNLPPHPDPSLFDEVSRETYRMLEGSLRRFLQAQYNNVGNNRVMCGMVAGILFILLGTIPVIILNFLRGDSRWSRLASLPGLWLGLTVLIASLNGICMGVYIFGDLRQLRTFELSRPPISKPQPLPAFVKPIVPRRLSTSNSILPIQSTDLQKARSRGRSLSTSSRVSRQTASTRSEAHTASDSDDGIEISQAYDDEDTVDGPATCTLYYATPDVVAEKTSSDENPPASPSQASFLSTASFIQPFELLNDDEDLESGIHPPSLQPVRAFDFDSLPRRSKSRSPPRTIHQPTLRELTMPQRLPTPPPVAKPSGFLARFQERCSMARWRMQPGYLESSGSSSGSLPGSPYISGYPGPQTPRAAFSRPPHSGRSLSITSVPYRDNFNDASYSPNPALSLPSPTYRPSSDSKISETTKGNANERSDSVDIKDGKGSKEEGVWQRFKKVKEVPAFAVPLTRVLSPVVVRGQWEIVVRSAIIAFLISWVVLGALLAAPVSK
ncbi:hypothetical protein CVT24_001567 [Panaeolus cyanescens]|uniref:RGS domain-containing protein n=1 Tax=Panaeolus cyanescens TaxID=181874 RepID=A0A409YFF0_9AGAR|nr:hypothetical protein CVT24_001567 [Panaeolus cyanescens]